MVGVVERLEICMLMMVNAFIRLTAVKYKINKLNVKENIV
jgi:hypothetical protein